MVKKYHVSLPPDQRTELERLVRYGTARAQTLTRARILLLVDDGLPDHTIVRALHVNHATVERVRQRYATDGLARALYDAPRPGSAPTLDGRQEAFLIALACSAPPDGRTRWTMQLLADRLIALQVVETISDETVRRTLKKITSSPGNAGNGASPR